MLYVPLSGIRNISRIKDEEWERERERGRYIGPCMLKHRTILNKVRCAKGKQKETEKIRSLRKAPLLRETGLLCTDIDLSVLHFPGVMTFGRGIMFSQTAYAADVRRCIKFKLGNFLSASLIYQNGSFFNSINLIWYNRPEGVTNLLKDDRRAKK